MTGTSKYLQLNNQILVEYIYTDPSSPEEYTAHDVPIEILTNGVTGENYIFNADSSIVPTGNWRNNSATPTLANKTQFAYLNTNLPLNYIDFNTSMTKGVNLLQNFLSPTTTN